MHYLRLAISGNTASENHASVVDGESILIELLRRGSGHAGPGEGRSMSVSSCGSVGGPGPIEHETSATEVAAPVDQAATQVTRGSAPRNPFAHRGDALQGALSNDPAGS